jgi:hypothetical protein
MAEKDPFISKLINFWTAFWAGFLLVLSTVYTMIINFCNLVIRVVSTALLILLVVYIVALFSGYATPPEWLNLPSFNLIVI